MYICVHNITNSIGMNLSKLQEIMEDRGAWCAAVHGFTKTWTWSGDLSHPGIKLVSPVLAVRFLTTEPTAKPFDYSFQDEITFLCLGSGGRSSLHLFRARPVSQWALRTHIDGVPVLHSNPRPKSHKKVEPGRVVLIAAKPGWSRTFSFLGFRLSSAAIQSPVSPEKNRQRPREANLPEPVLWVEAFYLHLPSLCLPLLHFWFWLNHKILRL